MRGKPWLVFLALLGMLLIGTVQAGNIPSVPNELYEALKLDREKVTTKELYDAVVKRYKDPEQGAGRGTLAQYWEPIPYGIYLDPATFYKSPTTNKEIASRKECVECHTDESPVWVQAWKRSTPRQPGQSSQLEAKRPDILQESQTGRSRKEPARDGQTG